MKGPGHHEIGALGALAAVRRRPGLFIGGTGPQGLEAMVLEVVGLCLDQFVAGHADRLTVTTGCAGWITIADNGSGLRTDAGPSGLPLVEEMFTTFRTAPTVDGGVPPVQLGFGIGMGPICALCSEVIVEIDNGKSLRRQKFSRGRAVTMLTRVGHSAGHSGTSIRLCPDPEIFDTVQLDVESLAERLRTLALISEGLTIQCNDQTFGPATDLTEFFQLRTNGQFPEPLLVSHHDGTSSVRLAIGWQNSGLSDVLLDPMVLPSQRFRLGGRSSESSPEILAFSNFRETDGAGREYDGVVEGLRSVFGATCMPQALGNCIVLLHLTTPGAALGGPLGRTVESDDARRLIAGAMTQKLPAQLGQPYRPSSVVQNG